jgi:hypothetical protein
MHRHQCALRPPQGGFSLLRYINRQREVEARARLLLRALDKQSARIVLSLNARQAREELRLALRGQNTRATRS